MNKIKKIAIFANSLNKDVLSVAEDFVAYFSSLGIAANVINLFDDCKDYSSENYDVDLIVSLGGDGTVLTTANITVGKNIPIIAVNMGTFGYITETPVSDFKYVLNNYIDGKAKLEKRMRLDVSVVDCCGNNRISCSSLNDITVASSSHAKVARTILNINGILASTLKGDGIIVSTPTGSTAYNLSAGGPILDASMESIIINPICPFTMGVRPLVINAESTEVCIEIPKQYAEIVLTVDGKDVIVLTTGDKVIIKKSKFSTVFVKNDRRNFIEILRDKLGWAGGFNA